MRLVALLLAVAPLAPAAALAAPPAPADAVAIRKTMADSAVAWNAGDLGGFMTSYEQGPDTVFVTSKGLVQGFDAIAAHYKAGYATGTADLGKLSFDEQDIRSLGPDYAVFYGRFHLVRAGKPKEDTGVFDLILHKGAKGWRIVSDHTS